jgi:hypothetical protein
MEMGVSIFNNNLTINEILIVKSLAANKNIGDLANYIENMSTIRQAELVLLAWKGRGDEITDEQYQLDYALEQTNDDMFAGYLARMPLDTYLSALGY